MAKFKGIFTFITFAWLWTCGFFAIDQWIAQEKFSWLGLVLNSWGLPAWMLLRYRWPQNFVADERESVALTVVLLGLAVALLTDTERSAALYLSILNLGLVLLYLFHFSSVHHPALPQPGESFPILQSGDGSDWDPRHELHQFGASGVLLVFLRGSFCASSRQLAATFGDLEPVLRRYNAVLLPVSTEPAEHWIPFISGNCQQRAFVTIAAGRGQNQAFVQEGGVPAWARVIGVWRAAGWRRKGLGACRPSMWLLDRDGYVLWRHLPANYRLPGSAPLLRSQLSRLDLGE